MNLKTIFLFLIFFSSLEFSFAQSSICIDEDGDGWGWDGSASCLISNDNQNNATGNSNSNTQSQTSSNDCIDLDGDGFGWDGSATCIPGNTTSVNTPANSPAPTATTTSPNNQASSSSSPCIDEDGDGFGWDGSATCIPGNTASINTPASSPATTTSPNNQASSSSSPCIDEDGDGYGWDGSASCIPESTSNVSTPASSPAPTATTTPPQVTPQSSSSITDVVLMMGQSNALGQNTTVQRFGVDAPNSRITVWTEFNGWQTANLCTQKWQNGWFPWRGGECSNHPAFQIAKGIIAADSSRRVAIIPTGIAGKPISWWDEGAPAYVAAKIHVENALSELSGISQVNLIAWSQGEADHGSENNWYRKLLELINRLKGETWFNAQNSVFIGQETKWSSINNRVKDLANDNDPLTDWVPASDLPTKDGVHWSSQALRELGRRSANKYLSIINR